MRALRDRYGFWFWLKWIVWFAGSFILSAVVWTRGLTFIFGGMDGREWTFTWCVSVFGTWFLLVIPFMRKKEQIWKRLNDDQERAVDAWFAGMAFLVGLFIASTLVWSYLLKDRIGQSENLEGVWLRNVMGTWLVILLPFLVYMYRKADSLFKTAHARQTYVPVHQTISVERSRRLLPDRLAAQLRSVKPTLPGGHVVSAVLKDGRRIPDIFVLNRSEILGVYDRPELDFSVSDIETIEPANPRCLPSYEESKWLRLDKVS